VGSELMGGVGKSRDQGPGKMEQKTETGGAGGRGWGRKIGGWVKAGTGTDRAHT
jgi:hypothetical protein